jgi:ribose 5-phosphate isomerase B
MTVIAVGADHAGFPLKEDVKVWLETRGHRVLDFGTHSTDAVDYPDYAAPVARAVAAGTAERGVLVCGSGIGMAMAANKIPGVRAAVCHDPRAAALAREHNDANVLALAGRTSSREHAIALLEAWLAATFLAGRHARRVEKLAALERAHAGREAFDAPAR